MKAAEFHTRFRVAAGMVLFTLALLIPPALARAASIAPTSDPTAIAAAFSSQPGLVVGASWPTEPGAANPPGPSAAGVGDGFTGTYMPDAGPSFGVLTTGSVEVADPPNDSPSAGVDNLQSTRNVHDLSQLRLDINVPAGASCLSFDLVFYSEEYPEFVGSEFDDGFLAELDSDAWTYNPETTSVDAPGNFAFDENGHLLTVNSATFAAEGSTELQYDGSTQLLEAATPVQPGSHSLYLSLFDAGDGIYDSAAFVDNLRTRPLPPSDCSAGARILDTDGDGLPDQWEEEGYDANGDGTVDVDLPAMGADPDHKDLFVELDAMKGLRLSQAAINKDVSSFAAAPMSNPDGHGGITLHVDNGPASVMDPTTGAVWGSRSRADDLGFAPDLGFSVGKKYNWGAFDSLKAGHFESDREPIFHYAISANRYGGGTSSGISRGIGASDFIVALGLTCNPEGSCPGPVNWQAGTFMHELGHNLGLMHGGRDGIQNKPNYLSVMNYSFQFPGVLGGGDDYSRFDGNELPSLDEEHVFESEGFNTSLTGYKTLVGCDFGSGNKTFGVVNISGPVDFNCDGDAADEDQNLDLNLDDHRDVLRSYDDWDTVKLKGGAIGGEGLSVLLPTETSADEPPASALAEAASALVPPPDLTGSGVAGITASHADVLATVNPRGEPVAVAVQYGRSAAYGSETPFQPAGEGTSPVDLTLPLDGLAGGTYHYQLVARSPDHLIYSADGSFDTAAPSAPPPAGSSFGPLTGPVTPPAKRVKCRRKSLRPKHVHGKTTCVKKHKKRKRHHH